MVRANQCQKLVVMNCYYDTFSGWTVILVKVVMTE